MLPNSVGCKQMYLDKPTKAIPSSFLLSNSHCLIKFLSLYQSATLTTIALKYNKTFFDFAKENIKITTITNSKSKSKTLDYIGYNDYTGQNEIYTENIDIVNPLILKAISTIDGYEIL